MSKVWNVQLEMSTKKTKKVNSSQVSSVDWHDEMNILFWNNVASCIITLNSIFLIL